MSNSFLIEIEKVSVVFEGEGVWKKDNYGQMEWVGTLTWQDSVSMVVQNHDKRIGLTKKERLFVSRTVQDMYLDRFSKQQDKLVSALETFTKNLVSLSEEEERPVTSGHFAQLTKDFKMPESASGKINLYTDTETGIHYIGKLASVCDFGYSYYPVRTPSDITSRSFLWFPVFYSPKQVKEAEGVS